MVSVNRDGSCQDHIFEGRKSVGNNADDLVIIADKKEDLQAMLDIVHKWCCTWEIQVNPSKTKVIHFRLKKKALSDFVFCPGCHILDYIHEYKYLGFNEFLDADESIQRVYDCANHALGVLIAMVKQLTESLCLSLAISLMPHMYIFCSCLGSQKKNSLPSSSTISRIMPSDSFLG